MTPTHPIHIIGAGIGGLTLARCLKNRGIKSIVFERNPSPAHHNYGITLQPWAIKFLINVLNIDQSTFARQVAVDGPKGGIVRVLHNQVSELGHRTGDFQGLRAHRGRLESLLREELHVKWGHVLEGFEASGTGHTLTFTDIGKVDCDIVVDTSGVHSPIRRSLLPEVRLNVLPYVVFRGTRRIDEATFRTTYAEHLKDGNILVARQGDILLQISINDYVTDHAANPKIPLHKPNRATNQASEISEAFFAEVSKLRGLHQPFRHAFDVENMRQGRTLHWLMRDLLLEKDELVRLTNQRRGLFLIGDAAHALPVLGGDGACSAIRDAVELANFMEENQDVAANTELFYGKLFGAWEEEIKRGQETLSQMHHEWRPNL